MAVTSPSPASGGVGTPVALQGRGFSITGSVSIYWSNATGSPYAGEGTTAVSSPNGWFNKTIDAPAGYAAGLFTFWAIGANNDCAGAIFNLTGGPTIALTPATGTLGSLVTVTGSGFSASDTSISITGAVLLFALPCTLSGGSITGSCYFQVDGGLAGPHTITGVGNVVGGPGDTATATFTLFPTIKLSPTSGLVGSSFTISGYDFSAYPSAADVTLDGALLTPAGGSDCGPGASDTLITLDPEGSFVCTFTVPMSATSGSNNLQGDDTFTGELTAEETFILPTPALSLSPTQGPSGATVTASGSGFTAGVAITFTISGGGTVGSASACTASGMGAFTGCTFTISGSSTGYTVTASGSDVGTVAADTATATFTVMAPSVVGVSRTTGAPGPTTFSLTGLAPNTVYDVYLDTTQGVPSAASYNPLGTCTSSPSGAITDCTVSIPSGLSRGTYYVDLFQDPTPPLFILSLFSFTLGGASSTGIPSSVLGFPILEFAIILLVVIVTILVVVAVVIHRRKATPPTPASPAKPRPKAPARPP